MWVFRDKADSDVRKVIGVQPLRDHNLHKHHSKEVRGALMADELSCWHWRSFEILLRKCEWESPFFQFALQEWYHQGRTPAYISHLCLSGWAASFLYALRQSTWPHVRARCCLKASALLSGIVFDTWAEDLTRTRFALCRGHLQSPSQRTPSASNASQLDH